MSNNNKKIINDIMDKKEESKNSQNDSSNLNLKVPKNDNSKNKQNYILTKIHYTSLMVYQQDYYANSIPLGSFCFAISSILNGLYDCHIHNREDPLLYLTIFLFGGVGQITTGIFEYIKSRTYPCALYLIYGLYFLSYFFGKYIGDEIFSKNNQKIFYGSWACLSFPIYIGSFKTNIFLSTQNLSTLGFFVIKCIGFCTDVGALKEFVPGILELIAGVASLYICFGQILNEHYRFQLFPSVPFMKENSIDNFMKKEI